MRLGAGQALADFGGERFERRIGRRIGERLAAEGCGDGGRVSGVGAPLRKMAELKLSAPGAGVKTPSNTAPLAWLARVAG